MIFWPQIGQFLFLSIEIPFGWWAQGICALKLLLNQNINPQMSHSNGFFHSWTDEKKCSLCTKCYTNKDSVTAHIRKIHTRLHLCKECSKGFGDLQKQKFLWRLSVWSHFWQGSKFGTNTKFIGLMQLLWFWKALGNLVVIWMIDFSNI